MKQLTCEMCGGIDLIKQDGVFVCQSCGCKYSVEDAKKMMVEGVVEVTGTVKVDGIQDLETLIENANTFVNLGEFKKAEDLFNKISNTYPKDYRGWHGKLQALTENFNSNTSVLNSDSKKNEFFMAYKNAIALSTDGETKHIKEQVSEYVNAVINAMKSEKGILERKLSAAETDFAKKRNEIYSAHNKLLAEIKQSDESFKMWSIIIAIIAIVVLIIHLFNANWWLLLTIPLCLGVAGGMLCAVSENDNPYSDNPPVKYEQIRKSSAEKDKKMKDLQVEYEKNTSGNKKRCTILKELLNIYNDLLNNINSLN